MPDLTHVLQRAKRALDGGHAESKKRARSAQCFHPSLYEGTYILHGAVRQGVGEMLEVQTPRPVAEARCAEGQREDTETLQPSKTEAEIAEGNTTRHTLSIHGMDGSTFHLSVEDATTVTWMC